MVSNKCETAWSYQLQAASDPNRKLTSIVATPIMTHCPCCNQPLDYYKQQLDPRSKLTPKWIGTCRTSDCDFEDVTLSDSNWTRIQTDEEFAAQYRGMTRRMKAQMAGR